MQPEHFFTASLHTAPWGQSVTRILAAAINAVEPAAAVRRYLQRDGDRLRVGERAYNLADYERVFVVGAGKAGAPMAQAAAEILGERLTGGVVIVKEGHVGTTNDERRMTNTPPQPSPPAGRAKGGGHRPSSIILLEAGHPVPDQRGIEATQRIADLLAGTTERDLVIALISGGGSALMMLPAPGISLEDMQRLTSALLACGATINEMNTLRKHLDQIKGGGLARMAHPASLITLILSDVVGNPLDVIASGPTVPDTSSFADAWRILEHYNIVAQVPMSIQNYLQDGLAGKVAETRKPGDPVFAHVENVIIASNAQSAQAALESARAEGLNTLLLTTYLQGEAREIGRALAAIGREMAASGQPLRRPACIVAGGETTVTLRGDGKGGRNQELALAAVTDMAGLENIVFVALATDGGDGPTDAAGAVVTGTTLEQARPLGLEPAAFLARNDAYHFFAALDDLLRPGPTNTNVNDLAFVFAF